MSAQYLMRILSGLTAAAAKCLSAACLGILLGMPLAALAQDNLSAGPLFDHFPLTLDQGWRLEVLGPVFNLQQKETEELFGVPPLFSWSEDAGTDSERFDFVYPLLTYNRYGEEHRWQFLQLLSQIGGHNAQEKPVKRFTMFPIYFQQRSPEPSLNYTALFPVYGDLQGRLFRDEIHFVLFPLYSKTRKKDVVTENYLYPIFHVRHGEALEGWQFWPLTGHEHKDVTTRTNMWGELETVPGHDRRFVLWPLFFNEHNNTGTDNPERRQALLPFYSYQRSPLRDSTTYLWPIGPTITDDRTNKYHEVGAPWPLIVFAHGEGKTASRVWPFYSRVHNAAQESDFYMWPVYKYNRFQGDTLDRQRTRILFFLYNSMTEKNKESGEVRTRHDLWPLFTQRRDFQGKRRLQVLALLEPIFPGNSGIERNYSMLWSLWRQESNPKTGASSQSLLWNLYRHDVTAEKHKTSLLLGLYQHESAPGGQRWRVCFIPFSKKRPAAKP